MKTTINLDDDLMRAVREHARRRGVTLTTVISDALRRALAEPTPIPTAFRLELPVTHGQRMPTLDIDSNAALEEYLDRGAQQALS